MSPATGDPDVLLVVTQDGGQSFEAAFPVLLLPAFRVALRILGNTADAEEVAAEALARAWCSWDRFEVLPYRTAWVVRVASNLAVDRARHRLRHPAAQVDEYVPDLAEASALRLALVAALAALPRRQRQVIALRYLGGMSEAEVAGSLGISLNSVKKHTSRAVVALRSRLGADWKEPNLAVE